MTPSTLLLAGMLAALVGSTTGTLPGMQAGLTNQGLDYLRQVALPILEAELQKITIPDFSDDVDTPVGHVTLSLSSIKLESLTVSSSSITVGSGAVTVALGVSAIAMHADWHYREDSWPHVSDSGSVDMSASGVTASLAIAVGMSPTHEPTVSVAHCVANVGSLSIELHGGASWLYNLFKSIIADAIKKELNGQLCTVITSEVNSEGNAELATLPETVALDATAELDFGLVTVPTYGTTYVLTSHQGEVLWIPHNTTHAPFTPTAIPAPTPAAMTRMFYLWVTPFLVESAAWVYGQAGKLEYNVTQNILPSDFPIGLNTTAIGQFIPELSKAYPGRPMQLALSAYAPKPATMSCATTGFNLTFSLFVGADVILANGTIVEAFKLRADIIGAGKAWIASSGTKSNLVGNLTFLEVPLSLEASTIGNITTEVEGLQEIAALLAATYIIPALNKYANKGFPLPIVDGVALVNPAVNFRAGYLEVETDFHYTPAAVEAMRHRAWMLSESLFVRNGDEGAAR